MEFNNNNNTNNFNPNSGRYAPFVSHEQWFEEKRYLKKLSSYNSIAVLIFLLVSQLIAQGLYFLGEFFKSNTKYEQIAQIWNSVPMQAVFQIFYSIIIVGVPFYIIALATRKKTGLVLPIEKPTETKGIVMLIVGGLGVCFFGNFLTGLLDSLIYNMSGVDVTAQVEPQSIPIDATSIIMSILASAVVPALIEEMSLRGIMMQPLRRYGDGFAIIVTSLTFALMHRTVAQIPFAFFAGIVLGYACVMTGSIWTSIIIHILNNLVSVVGTILMPQLETNQTMLLMFNLFYYGVMIIGVGLFVLYYFKVGKKKPLHSYENLNVGKHFYEHLSPYCARISNATLVKEYITTVPFILSLIIIIFDTVRGLIQM